MTELYEIKVKLFDNQKKDLISVYFYGGKINLRLEEFSLYGNDSLYVPNKLVKLLEETRKLKEGLELDIIYVDYDLKCNCDLLLSDQVKLFSQSKLKPTQLQLLPDYTLKPTQPQIQLISDLAQLRLLLDPTQLQLLPDHTQKPARGFFIPCEKIEQILQYYNMLNDEQSRDVYNAIQTRSGVHIKLTVEQRFSFLGSFLEYITDKSCDSKYWWDYYPKFVREYV